MNRNFCHAWHEALTRSDGGKESIAWRVRSELNIYRCYHYWRREGVIFVHVPKAAGTSINKALYGRTLGHYRAADIKTKFPGLYNRLLSFSAVRNPWDRVLSAYRFAKIGRTPTMGIWNPKQYQTESFSTFERFLHEWLAHKDLTQVDFVFQPQNWFVCHPCKPGNVIVDYLAKVERLQLDIEIVNKKLSRELTVCKLNMTGDGLSDYRKAYTSSEMVDLVYSIYGQDIDTFNYDFE